LLDAVGDLAGDFLGGRARPVGADHHRLEGEGRILALAQLAIGQHAGHRQHQHEIEHDLAVAQRPGGEIECHGYSPRVRLRFCRSTGWICWPSTRMCTPAATTQSSALSPSRIVAWSWP